MSNPWRSAATALALLLIASLLANAWLIQRYQHQRDSTTTAQAALTAMTTQRDAAHTAAAECSQAVDSLRTLAEQRARVALAARTAAAATAHSHNQRADTILAAPAAVPGDDCRSAQVRVHDWLQGRAQP